MSYIPNISSSSVIDAVLTRKGRQILTSHDQIFRIVKFGLGDQEINYKLLNPDNIDQDDPDILNLPIPEPSTNETSEMLQKIWVNQSFLDQRFIGTTQAQGQSIFITTNVGDKALIYSDDTVNKCSVWFSTFNALDRPYVADSYHLVFSSDIDCYSIEFTNPVLNDTTNLNYTKVSDTDYIFNAVNSDGSGKYERTTTSSAPSVVFNIRFAQTPNFFQLIQQPQNKQSIIVPNFLTVTQIDSTRTPLSDVSSATLSLEIKNLGN